MLQKIEGRGEGVTEDEMVGWHHRLNGLEFEQILRNGDGQGSLAYCSSWGRKESDTTEQLNNNWRKKLGVYTTAVFPLGDHSIWNKH